ncbi:MAG: nucleotide sugar dehydrogenase, partial [Bacteroidales bacterium]|nr:nucleotide sugar dehydrogenase [Bacteroidales bacterium]
DTHDVIAAASTKWNFIKMTPGLVGGHCIGIDPYYLMQKAQVFGVLPRIMTASRELNDGMGEYVAYQVIKCMNKKGIRVKDSKILILGVTFKENCADIRNTKVVDIYNTLLEYTPYMTIFDGYANYDDAFNEYGLRITNDWENVEKERYDAVILAVAHKEFIGMDVRRWLKQDGIVYDVKGVLPKNIIDARL